MLWLAFEARRGAKGQGTLRDDVEGVGGATGSVRVFHMTTDDTRIVCGVPMTLDLSCASCVLYMLSQSRRFGGVRVELREREFYYSLYQCVLLFFFRSETYFQAHRTKYSASFVSYQVTSGQSK
jgi:hypothetical protein